MSLEEEIPALDTTDSIHCYLCDNTEIVNSPCVKCKNLYCRVCSSKIDPAYCDECLSDITIEEKNYTKVEVDYDHLKDKLIERRTGCTQITFRGIDWMFTARRISDMSEEEVKVLIRYHQAHVSLLESELVSKQIKKQKAQYLSVGGRTLSIGKVTKTVEKKTIKPNAGLSIEQLAAAFIKAGITDINKIQELLMKKS